MTSASRILDISKRFISLARGLTSSTMTCSSMMAAAKAGVEILPASTNSNTDRYGTVQNSHYFQDIS